MSQEYINREIDTILENLENTDSHNKAMAAVWIIGNLKGINLKVMDLSEANSIASYYVLGSATNITQAKSMADEVLNQFARKEFKVISKEGMNSDDWILIDGGDVIVHIFQESARDSYDLEDLWNQAKNVTIPNEYYFSSDSDENQASDDDKGRDFF